MFSESKYTNWYFSIIDKAKSQKRSKKDGVYYEKHHIIPKSLGGPNQGNLVRLTAKEHFICHLLLVHMTTGKNRSKMYYALNVMARSKKYPERHNSALFKFHREKLSASISGKHNRNYGCRWTDEKRKQMSDHFKADNKRLGANNAAFGIERIDLSTRNKLPKRWITRDGVDKQVLIENTESYLSDGWEIGRAKVKRDALSPETIERMAAARRGTIPWNKRN